VSAYSYALDGNSYKFQVKSSIQPATIVVVIMLLVGWFGNLGIVSAGLMLVGLFFWIFVALEYFLNRRNMDFSVSPDGIMRGQELIQKSRINSVDIRNSKGDAVPEGVFVERNFTNMGTIASHNLAKNVSYVVSVLHGGKRTKLAGGLTADTASGLVADIKCALSGELS
jgi:hypothetical protein